MSVSAPIRTVLTPRLVEPARGVLDASLLLGSLDHRPDERC